jgi:hypothetical protein
MENSAKKARVQRSEAEIRSILKEHDSSNVSVREFCEIYEIHEATFYNWRNKYGPKSERTSGFIEMELGGTTAGSPLFAEIELPGKGIIRLFQKVEPSYFKALF